MVKKFIFLLISLIPILTMGLSVIVVDPFFHYHAPNVDKYYYTLDNQRYQNDGIVKNFSYEGLITGASVVENFKTSEAERLFDTQFIKVPFSGGTYKEVNDCVKKAIDNNKNVKIVIRSLDRMYFYDDIGRMREDMGEYPYWLYDNCLYNDFENYIFNRQLFIKRIYPMVKKSKNEAGGITSFDDYSNWMEYFEFGNYESFFGNDDCINTTFPAQEKIDSDLSAKVRDNIIINATKIADDNPNVMFYYFFPPDSAIWWYRLLQNGEFEKCLSAQQIIIEEILKHSNIKLFAFDEMTNVTTDLNNYKDYTHYGEWVNSIILDYMSKDIHLITADNYEHYLQYISDFYYNYDFSNYTDSVNYENDYYAAVKLYQYTNAIIPKCIEFTNSNSVVLSGAEKIVVNGEEILKCTGRLERDYSNGQPIEDYLYNEEYIGVKLNLNKFNSCQYITFWGKKESDNGQLVYAIYDETGNAIKLFQQSYKSLDDEWHMYIINLYEYPEGTTLIINGAYTDTTGRKNSEFQIKELLLY